MTKQLFFGSLAIVLGGIASGCGEEAPTETGTGAVGGNASGASPGGHAGVATSGGSATVAGAGGTLAGSGGAATGVGGASGVGGAGAPAGGVGASGTGGLAAGAGGIAPNVGGTSGAGVGGFGASAGVGTGGVSGSGNASGAALGGTAGGGASGGTPGTCVVGAGGGTFAQVTTIIARSCGTSDCHPSEMGFHVNLQSADGMLRTRLMGMVPNMDTDGPCRGRALVVPCSPETSLIMAMIGEDDAPRNGCGIRMPDDCPEERPCLPDADIETIRSWIAAGAPP